MISTSSRTLRGAIVVVILCLLVTQVVLLPWAGAEVVRDTPEVSWLRWQVLAGAVVVLLLVQIALVCLWRLIPMIRDRRVRQAGDADRRAVRLVDVILGCVVAGTLLVTAMNVLLTSVAINPPLVAMSLALGTVGGAALAVVVVVQRGRLARRARQSAGAVTVPTR